MTLLILLWLQLQPPAQASSRLLGCGGPFTADLTEARLVEIYGADNVRAGEVYVGEGFSEPGAVVFPDSPSDRIEVVWSNEKTRALPRFVRVREKGTRWRTSEGITVGSDLQTIERLNGRPFRLLGFQWDYQGTVMSWGGGRLTKEEGGGCRLRLRLSPPGDEWPPIANQVSGEREFSSGHPVMQQLNPRVYQLWLSFESPRKQE